jgi:DNA modification methylase
VIADQEYELVAADRLTPHPDNPRRGNLAQLAESVEANGFYGAIVAQRSTGHVLAGNHRLLAARQQGLDQVPVVWLDVDDDRARRILLVDNRTNDLAAYDEESLLALLGDLPDLTGTGYTAEDLLTLAGADSEHDEEPQEAAERPDKPRPPRAYPDDATVLHGDCLEVMRTLPADSIDAVVTDPPYGLGFMGKAWDDLPPGVEWAAECLRVLKPGGHLLAFGGTRTYHRLACAIEDAGFEIRDSITWLYGSGFPKSLDVSKAIDKAAGAQREAGPVDPARAGRLVNQAGPYVTAAGWSAGGRRVTLDPPATPEAEKWQGWGTALKPSSEPIVVARKPLAGTVAANVLEHGTGAINVDGCRVEYVGTPGHAHFDGRPTSAPGAAYGKTSKLTPPHVAGRWPANVILTHTPGCEQTGTRRVRTGTAVNRNRMGTVPRTVYGDGKAPTEDATYADADGTETVPAYNCAPGCPVAELDAQSGERPGAVSNGSKTSEGLAGSSTFKIHERAQTPGYADTGGASRFFPTFRYDQESACTEDQMDGSTNAATSADAQPKSMMPKMPMAGDSGMNPPTATIDLPTFRYQAKAPTAERPDDPDTDERHATVKPLELMRWLVRLVTPPRGRVLEPFAGSGTTVEACLLEGFRCTAIEREAGYLPLIQARIDRAVAATAQEA